MFCNIVAPEIVNQSLKIKLYGWSILYCIESHKMSRAKVLNSYFLVLLTQSAVIENDAPKFFRVHTASDDELNHECAVHMR